jgi:hypothetical protein
VSRMSSGGHQTVDQHTRRRPVVFALCRLMVQLLLLASTHSRLLACLLAFLLECCCFYTRLSLLLLACGTCRFRDVSLPQGCKLKVKDPLQPVVRCAARVGGD